MSRQPARQQGYVIVLVLIALSIAAGFLINSVTDLKSFLERKEKYQSALAEAREALIAYAITYRDTHPTAGPAYTEVYGFLPCPDLNNDGVAEPTCGASDVSVIGRLPWRTLGIPPLRDGAGECLWYAVSGHGKNSPQTTSPNAMNWDTLGQFNLYDTTNTLLAGSTLPSGNLLHTRPLAVIFAGNTALPGQARNGAAINDCPGNNVIRNYLDALTDPNHPDAIYGGAAPAANAPSNLTVSASGASYNNDQALPLSASDLFARILKRGEFKKDIDNLLNDYANCLNALPVPSLPAASIPNKGIDAVVAACPPPTDTVRRNNVIAHWRNNLLYAKPAGGVTVNGQNCAAVLLFGGQRTGTQSRATATEITAPANYLEGANATTFPNPGAYTGNIGFNPATPSADLARCIIGLPAGATQQSFAADLASANVAGSGATPNLVDKTLTVVGSGGATGGCLWFPNPPLPTPTNPSPSPLVLAGKTLRAFFRYQFSTSDDSSMGGAGNDRGNGFTFELVRSDKGSPAGYCGRTTDMGALALASFGVGGTIGMTSFIFEQDVYQDGINNDPAGNHIATLFNGNLAHSPTNGYTTNACNGSAAGCLLTPLDTLEETPSPSQHAERIEIKTGCDSTCTSCTPTLHVAPNDYARIRSWIDCTDCFDVTQDFTAPPNTQTCKQLDPNLNTPYFGFTGGFRSGASTSQGVLIQDFVIRTE